MNTQKHLILILAPLRVPVFTLTVLDGTGAGMP